MFKKQNFFIVYIVLLYTVATAQNSGDNVFRGIQVHTIKMKFDQPNFWDSLTTYYTQGNERYIAASVTLDGTTLDSCGVRLKGNSSYSHPNNKKSMKIDFNQYRSDQRWDDLKGIFVNNCFSDPTFMREKIHLDFCKDAGIPAPRASYAMVYINDIVWGLYTIVEPIDKNFLSTHYSNKKGNLFKAVDAFGAPGGGGVLGGTTSQILSDFRWYGTDTTTYYSRYELKTEDSTTPWSDIITVIDILNNSFDIGSTLSEKINLTSIYKGIGTDILFGSLDSYTESGRNFYIYFNPSTKKMEWIIWDTNMSFGGYPGKSTSVESLSLTYTSSTTSRPLTGKIFTNAELKNQYLKTLYEVYNKYFSSSRLFPHIDSIGTVIRPYVILDSKKQYTLAQFDANITNDITTTQTNPGGGAPGGGMGERKPGLKSFITTRQANVKTQFTSLGFTGIEDLNHDGEIPTEYILCQNFPNPFNPSTIINYQLPVSGAVSLIVYDVLGNEVITLVNEFKPSGSYSVKFNGTSLSSGVYFYKLITSNFSSVKKMLLVK
jgi:spore coat protein CotH